MRANADANSLFIAIVTTALALLILCCRPNSQAELWGVYMADYDKATERVVLNRDGTLVHEVTLKATGKLDVTKGYWKFDPDTGYITFKNNFMVVLDGFGQLNPDYVHPKTGVVVLPAEKHYGFLSLGTEEGTVYKKMK